MMTLRDIQTILQHVRLAPPTCIAGVAPQLEPPECPSGDENGTIGTGFWIGCPCGCRATGVLGFPTNISGDSYILSPLSLVCPGCGKVTEFFDSDRHGYDPEVCGDSVTMRGSGRPQRYRCGCGHDVGRSIVTFSFNNPQDLLSGLPESLAGREQDAFDWFDLSWECAACGKMSAVADYERA